jgi:hypothetical protein
VDKKVDVLYSKKLSAGRKTYFIDVQRVNVCYIKISECSKDNITNQQRRFSIMLYPEDFNKFLGGLTEAINYVKKNILKDFDYDKFSHKDILPPKY